MIQCTCDICKKTEVSEALPSRWRELRIELSLSPDRSDGPAFESIGRAPVHFCDRCFDVFVRGGIDAGYVAQLIAIMLPVKPDSQRAVA
jgi:hypothetical protein